MEINVSKIKMTPGASQALQLSAELSPEAYGYGEYRLTEPVAFQGRLSNEGGGCFALQGSYETAVALICSRCGREFSQPAAGELSVRFAADPQPDTEGECSVYPLAGDNADLGEVLAGEIFFSLPMQPLCRPDCRGLCPVCGADLNQHSCSCHRENIDPRWEKLKGLIIED